MAPPRPELDEWLRSHVARLDARDAGELLTLQRAAWLSEAIEGATLAIPALHESLTDVAAQLTDPAVLAWGVREDGRLLATARLLPGGSPGTVLLGRLGVVPDRVGEGLGGAMLRFAEAQVPRGTRRIELITGVNSGANHRFYAARGYLLDSAAIGPDGTVTFARRL